MHNMDRIKSIFQSLINILSKKNRLNHSMIKGKIMIDTLRIWRKKDKIKNI